MCHLSSLSRRSSQITLFERQNITFSKCINNLWLAFTQIYLGGRFQDLINAPRTYGNKGIPVIMWIPTLDRGCPPFLNMK